MCFDEITKYIEGGPNWNCTGYLKNHSLLRSGVACCDPEPPLSIESMSSQLQSWACPLESSMNDTCDQNCCAPSLE